MEGRTRDIQSSTGLGLHSETACMATTHEHLAVPSQVDDADSHSSPKWADIGPLPTVEVALPRARSEHANRSGRRACRPGEVEESMKASTILDVFAAAAPTVVAVEKIIDFITFRPRLHRDEKKIEEQSQALAVLTDRVQSMQQKVEDRMQSVQQKVESHDEALAAIEAKLDLLLDLLKKKD